MENGLESLFGLEGKVERWVGLIAKFGVVVLIEAFGLLFLSRSLANFQLSVALIGVSLVIFGALVELAITFQRNRFVLGRLKEADSDYKRNAERIAALERAFLESGTKHPHVSSAR